MKKNIECIIEALGLFEKLKNVFRHSWTSEKRQESVADHSWRVGIMLILVEPYLQKKIDFPKAIQMALIHDLPECITGDIHLFDYISQEEKRKIKFDLENQAMLKIKKKLPIQLGEKIYNLWLEFERNVSYEAKIVLALDRLEAHLQHNEAPNETWTSDEIKSIVNGYLDECCNCDNYISELKNSILEFSKKKFPYESF